MALSDQLTKLAARAKETEDRVAAAKSEARAQLEQDVQTAPESTLRALSPVEGWPGSGHRGASSASSWSAVRLRRHASRPGSRWCRPTGRRHP
jgi:hypothetical protein